MGGDSGCGEMGGKGGGDGGGGVGGWEGSGGDGGGGAGGGEGDGGGRGGIEGGGMRGGGLGGMVVCAQVSQQCPHAEFFAKDSDAKHTYVSPSSVKDRAKLEEARQKGAPMEVPVDDETEVKREEQTGAAGNTDEEEGAQPNPPAAALSLKVGTVSEAAPRPPRDAISSPRETFRCSARCSPTRWRSRRMSRLPGCASSSVPSTRGTRSTACLLGLGSTCLFLRPAGGGDRQGGATAGGDAAAAAVHRRGA